MIACSLTQGLGLLAMHDHLLDDNGKFASGVKFVAQRFCSVCKHSLHLPNQKLPYGLLHMLLCLSDTGLFRLSCATLFFFLKACVR